MYKTNKDKDNNSSNKKDKGNTSLNFIHLHFSLKFEDKSKMLIYILKINFN